jgi:hypothetical protein
VSIPIIEEQGKLILDIGSRLGVPLVVLILVFWQISPKIDHGISIADHVDAELQYLALRGCAPLPGPTP